MTTTADAAGVHIDSNSGAQPLAGMRLGSLSIKNFRACLDTTVTFQKDLTVLVGENNSGKSAVIDALRLTTTPLSGRRSRYFEHGDLARSHKSESISIKTEFVDLTDIQRGMFIGATNTRTGACSYTFSYRDAGGNAPRARPIVTVGPGDAPDPDPTRRDQICHVYLAPLRDAQRELDSPDGARLATIMELLHEAEDRDAFLEEANESLGKLNSHELLKETTSKVQRHVTGLTEAVRGQEVGVHFTSYSLRRLARSLRLKMADAGLDLAHLADSGLGYANLVYIATVLLELQNARDTELTLFLVEEPEAHLHPQLQAVLLEYLQEQARESLRSDETGPAGRIQVIVTTHSPNLASSVRVENVVVMKCALDSEGESLGSKAVAVSNLALEKKDLRKITQYLDATKAALLFARRVILVEGIAESVLLPIIAKHVVLPSWGKYPRLFSGVTVIPVGGVDFEPYVRLLLKPDWGQSILDKLVIITDRDPEPGSDGTPDKTRKDRLEAIAAGIGGADKLCVFDSDYTLEADLLATRTNEPLLRAAYLDQHPKSAEKWDRISGSSSPEATLHEALRAEKRLISKGEFAHNLAQRIADGESFVAPRYLAEAIACALDLEPEA